MATVHSNTLRTLFPQPKPVYKKNFIKENVKHIKEIQGIIQNSVQTGTTKKDKYRNYPPRNTPVVEVTKNRSGPLKTMTLYNKVRNTSNRSLRESKSKIERPKLQIDELPDFETYEDKDVKFPSDEKRTNRFVQTERTNDLKEIYEHGVIKYPSAYVLKNIKQKKVVDAKGDATKIDKTFQNLSLETEKNFVKDNTVIKSKATKNELDHDPTRAPPNYKKGVVPKYLREDKEKTAALTVDIDCPPGHVLLPDEERKETLRVLRQSYADRIQELNSMPVRSDTLRMRRRKMEIEEELKKIDEGIKVFQRPKVFVKIDA